MNKSSPSATEAPPVPVRVAPLTQSGKKSGDLYKRHEDVEAEISEKLKNDPTTWTLKSLKSETLVYLVRWIRPGNDLDLIGKVIGELGRRLTRIAKDFSSGLSKTEAEDFAADVAAKVNCLIFAEAPSRQSDFLEVSFRYAVKRHSLQERAKVDERKSRVIAETSLGATQNGEESGDGIVVSLPDDEPSPEEQAMDAEIQRLNPERTREALAAITNPLHRDAFILHVLNDWPIKSNDPRIPTLSMHFRKSGRQIQNWLNEARQEMRTALGDIS